MPLNYRTIISAMLLFAALAAPTQAADIEIKGIRLGMTRDELIAQGATLDSRQKLIMPGFTIGGVSEVFDTPGLFFEDDKLDMFTFFFCIL